MKDACEYPGCKGGGVPGNENILHGAVLCDFCTVNPLATGWAATRQMERERTTPETPWPKRLRSPNDGEYDPTARDPDWEG